PDTDFLVHYRLLLDVNPFLAEGHTEFLLARTDLRAGSLASLAGNPLDDQLFTRGRHLNVLVFSDHFLAQANLASRNPLFVDSQDFTQQLNALPARSGLASAPPLCGSAAHISAVLLKNRKGLGCSFGTGMDCDQYSSAPQFGVKVPRLLLWNPAVSKRFFQVLSAFCVLVLAQVSAEPVPERSDLTFIVCSGNPYLIF